VYSPTPLLTTKLFVPPPRPTLVPRLRLVERLNEGMAHKLTLVSAPAGFGKTTLLSDWIQRNKISVAWLSLDKSDNDPLQFLNYIIASLQGVETNIGKSTLSILKSPHPPPMESLLTVLINEITSFLDSQTSLSETGLVLVLDDYHVIDSKSIHKALTFLLDHLPPQMHLIIVTRADPPLPLARLRARNQLTELRATDLGFTDVETTLFFNKIMRLGLSANDIALLQSRTEGWIAGLQLAALSMQGRENLAHFIKSFTGDDRLIVDYLAEEVLNRQPEHIQQFLLHTSILNRLCGPLCDVVTEKDNSRRIIDELEKSNLFIVPLDNKRQWYRYHHLFVDLLRHRLHLEKPHQEAELHLRACEWYANNGLISEAINHALTAGDFERAATLMEPIAMTTLFQSKLTTLQNWLHKLPKKLIESHPRLCLSQAWAYFVSGHLNAIPPLLQLVEARLSQPTKSPSPGSAAGSDEILGQVLAIRAFLARGEGDIPVTIKLSREGFERLPKSEAVARCTIALNLGYSYFLNGEMKAADHYLKQAGIIAKKIGNPYVALTAIYSQADILRKQGKLWEAIKVYQKASQLGIEWGEGYPLPATGYAYVGLGQIFYEWNDLEETNRYVTRGIELGEDSRDLAITFRGNITLARLKQASGETQAALNILDHAEEIARQSIRILEDSQEWRVDLWRVWFWLKQGNLELATLWATHKKFEEIGDVNYLNEFEHLLLARILIAQEKTEEAMLLLNRLLAISETEKRTASVIEIQMLRALALETQGTSGQAMIDLGKALSLAKPGGYIRLFINEGKPIANLLEKLLDSKIDFPRSYANKLLLNMKLPTPLAIDAGLIEPLSERELDVLRCLAAGLSNREITEKLFISLNTVKTHLKNINDKLNVHNRTQAVACARELGIL